MRGSLHSATDDEAVRRSGRDDGICRGVEIRHLWGRRDDVSFQGRACPELMTLSGELEAGDVVAAVYEGDLAGDGGGEG
jgi:hypothetical protein